MSKHLTIKHFFVPSKGEVSNTMRDASRVITTAAYVSNSVAQLTKDCALVQSATQALQQAAQNYQYNFNWSYESRYSGMVYNLLTYRCSSSDRIHSNIIPPYDILIFRRDVHVQRAIDTLKDLLNTWQTCIETGAGIKYEYPIWEVLKEDKNHPGNVEDIENDDTWRKTMKDAVYTKAGEIIYKALHVRYTPNLTLTEMVDILNFVHNYTLFDHWRKDKSEHFYSIVFLK